MNAFTRLFTAISHKLTGKRGTEPRAAALLPPREYRFASDDAEQLRREFSANVSHELKTPLTTISGFAEIIASGIAKPEYYRDFAGKIKREADRLIDLVDDIIEISRLDECDAPPDMRPLNLLVAAEDIVARLIDKAERLGVAIRLTGVEAWIDGNAQIIHEIINNLCDNAIKYNRPGGRVEVDVAVTGSRTRAEAVTLTVSDTGIGIPPEHQSRVFERFYRVDKSHSKETGGTGLGLSIVKHGAQLHGAELSMTSIPDVGTTITLRFAAQGRTP